MARRDDLAMDDAPPVVIRPPAVQAVFDPAGEIHLRVVAPSGNAYELKPRFPFQIASEDVEWFFSEFDWQHRQRLFRLEEYRLSQAQFDNGRQVKDRVVRPQFDNGEANRKARIVPPVQPQFDNGAANRISRPASVPEASPPKQSNKPALVRAKTEAGEGNNEDKE